MLQLWTNKNGNYIEEKDAENCKECGNYIEFGNIVLDASQNTRRAFVSFYCVNCIKKIKMFGDQIQQIPFMIIKRLPKDVEPFFIKPITLTSGQMLSTFDITNIEKLGGITEDKTKYGGRSDKILNLLEEKRQELNLIDEEKNKLLTNNSEIATYIKNLGVNCE